MINALPIICLDNKYYFVDTRLMEIRNIHDPYDAEPVSDDLIDFWKSRNMLIVPRI